MEQHKLEMNFNQEELEQWSLAAKQKEEDNLALEKYRRQDEIKVKELNLEIEKLTVRLALKNYLSNPSLDNVDKKARRIGTRNY